MYILLQRWCWMLNVNQHQQIFFFKTALPFYIINSFYFSSSVKVKLKKHAACTHIVSYNVFVCMNRDWEVKKVRQGCIKHFRERKKRRTEIIFIQEEVICRVVRNIFVAFALYYLFATVAIQSCDYLRRNNNV